MDLFHVGLNIIKDIDLKRGRSNADFGQGFYLSKDIEFSKKWAITSDTSDTILNIYNLDISNLNILEFKERDEKWFDYIYKNRNLYEDIYKDYDVIIGPIANDTIFDLYGIVTSGLIDNELALKILKEGPSFTQIVIKTEKAKSKLNFIRYETLNKEEINEYKKDLRKLEGKYQDTVFTMLNDNVKDILS